ncbi:MAG: RloB family protein [Leptospirales bacterium]
MKKNDPSWGTIQKSSSLSRHRRDHFREPSKRCLIVCEGQKTEPNDFKSLRSFLRLPTINVEIAPNNKGTDPLSVVKRAQELFMDAKRDQNPYDAVFCVFDRDTHRTYFNAIEAIDAIVQMKRSGKPFEAIDSNPCFEYWILLHFHHVRRVFTETSKLSLCGSVEKDLKNHFPRYEKGMKGLFDVLHDKTPTALSNAMKANNDAENTGEYNPSTRVPLLFEKLLTYFPEELSKMFPPV